MPDDVDARSADGEGVRYDKNSPDLVGEELADSARIWRVYDRVAREEDRERIGNWNRGLDNLALFAGLFSAVTTAFIIEARQDTQPDYGRLSFLVLNASVAGVPFKEEPFAIDPSVRTLYCLWIASLLLSLSAALIAIMGKDWIGMYASRPVCNPRQWAEIRTFRLSCVEHWYMSGVIASAPVLLHISLLLFAVGLVLFVSPDPISQRVALGLSLAAAGLYLVTVLSAIIFPTSPFRSPATQAIRGAIKSVSASLYDKFVYPPKGRPIAALQQAEVIIGAALSHPLPASILPMDRSQRRRLRGVDLRMCWNRLFPPNRSDAGQSWRDTPRLFVRASWKYMSTFPSSVSARVRSALDTYCYHRQRPRMRPWHSSMRLWLPQLASSDDWSDIRHLPTPQLLAQSLSHLNATTQSMDVFRAILVALGDIAIGPDVAPLVSSSLKSRLVDHIRQHSPTADLVTQSLFVLAELHLSYPEGIELWDLRRLTGQDRPSRSESVVFALVKFDAAFPVAPETIDRHFPDILTQPRALKYLLPIVRTFKVFIILLQRYWDPLDDDLALDIEGHLRQLLHSWYGSAVEADFIHHFGCRSGLVELLVCIIAFLDPRDVRKSACGLLFKALHKEARRGVREHRCLVFAFGHDSPEIASAAWAALPTSSLPALKHAYRILELALPLGQSAIRKVRTAPVADRHRTFDICLARTVIKLLHPSRYFMNYPLPRVDGIEAMPWKSTLELCVRCLHMHFCQDRSSLDDAQRLEIATLLLEKSALIRVTTVLETRFDLDPPSTIARIRFNIITAIARLVTALLGSGISQDCGTGARLFCLFSFSSATDPDGQPVSWDLGSYIRTAPARLSEQKPGADVSLRRLIRALRALRALCAPRDDLRAAWEHIDLAPDPEYHDSFWDDNDFALELAPLLPAPDASLAEVEAQEHTLWPMPSQTLTRWLGLTPRCTDACAGLLQKRHTACPASWTRPRSQGNSDIPSEYDQE